MLQVFLGQAPLAWAALRELQGSLAFRTARSSLRSPTPPCFRFPALSREKLSAKPPSFSVPEGRLPFVELALRELAFLPTSERSKQVRGKEGGRSSLAKCRKLNRKQTKFAKFQRQA